MHPFKNRTLKLLYAITMLFSPVIHIATAQAQAQTQVQAHAQIPKQAHIETVSRSDKFRSTSPDRQNEAAIENVLNQIEDFGPITSVNQNSCAVMNETAEIIRSAFVEMAVRNQEQYSILKVLSDFTGKLSQVLRMSDASDVMKSQRVSDFIVSKVRMKIMTHHLKLLKSMYRLGEITNKPDAAITQKGGFNFTYDPCITDNMEATLQKFNALISKFETINELLFGYEGMDRLGHDEANLKFIKDAYERRMQNYGAIGISSAILGTHLVATKITTGLLNSLLAYFRLEKSWLIGTAAFVGGEIGALGASVLAFDLTDGNLNDIRWLLNHSFEIQQDFIAFCENSNLAFQDIEQLKTLVSTIDTNQLRLLQK